MSELERRSKSGAPVDVNQIEHARMFTAGLGRPATHDETVKVKAYLAANPDELARMEGLADKAAELVIKSATTWVYEQESVKGQMADLRVRLGYESSNVIERLAIEQAVIAWARLHFLENNLSHAVKGSHSKELAHYWDRRVSMAQHRYNQALISLAKIRKLKLPDITAIQANVAYVNSGEGPVAMRANRLLPAV